MQLIVNADDFGLTSGVNRAIIDCHLAGSVTSTTLMVTMPAAEEAVALAESCPNLGVGLHFNLTLGAPLAAASEVPSLVDRHGRFYRRSSAEIRAITSIFKPSHIRVELHAQYRRCVSLGLIPTHIDSHQHIHAFPSVFDVVAGFCSEHGIPLRMPRVSMQQTRRLRRSLRALVLAALVRRNDACWRGRVRMNAGFGSVFDLVASPEEIGINIYRNLLAASVDSPFELMVHPALVDGELAGMTSITAYSDREGKLLSDSGFSKMANALGWSLTNYRRAFS